MSEYDDAVRMDFDEPVKDEHPWDGAPRTIKGKKKKREKIPVLPKPEKPLTDTDVRRGVSNLARSAANLKIEGYSYQEIADTLELRSAGEAKRLVESTLAAIHGTADLETLRLTVAARAERLFQQSLAMASADFLVDKRTNKKLANPDRLRWHQQASVDLMNYATITGAKAPAKVEITPGEADLDEIVARLMKRAGQEEILEAEVIELDALPSGIDRDEDLE